MKEPRFRLLALALVVFLGLAATTEERLIGTITDDQQMLETSVAIAELGEIGLPRGGVLLFDRPGGDAVSHYGLGLPLLEAIPSLLARPLERRFGIGASQTIYALFMVTLVTLAAVLAAATARALGAPPAGEAIAAFGTAFGSPLLGYVSTANAEPLQAVLLAATCLLALRPGGRAAVAAGAAVGLAVLTKSLHIVVAPLLLLPVLLAPVEPRARRRAILGLALGALPPLLLWAALDIVRYGRLFGSYPGERFSMPPLEGLWRVTVGPSKGLFVYFPLGVLGLVRLAKALRRPTERNGVSGIAAAFLTLLALVSAWWACDGPPGWGPRLLVPTVPLLAALAGVAATTPRGKGVGMALVVVGLSVNLLGALQPESATLTYLAATRPVLLSPDEAARLAAPQITRGGDGTLRIPRHFVSARDPALVPIRVHAFFLSARLAGTRGEVERRLASPPWAAVRPEAVLPVGRIPPFLKEPFRWPYLGRTLSVSGRVEGRAAWYQAMVAQAYRAIDMGRADRALRISRELFDLQLSGFSAALHAEALRASGRFADLATFRAALPAPQRDTIAMGIVRALEARDRGDEVTARETLRRVAEKVPRPAIVKSLELPLSRWPRTLRAMLAGPS